MATKKEIQYYIKKQEYENRLVFIDNNLARKGTKYTLEEEKIFLAIVSQLNAFDKTISFDKNIDVIINKSDLLNLLGMEKQNDRYKLLKRRLRILVEKSIFDTYNPETELDMIGVVFTDVVMGFRSNDIKITLNKNFLPLLFDLKERYTKFGIQFITQFDSKYSLTLYKYLKSISPEKGEFETAYDFTTKQLKELFGLEKEDYCKIDGSFDRYNFEKKTIEKAINEINEKTDIFQLKYEKLKRNGKVACYLFSWIDRTKLVENDDQAADEKLVKWEEEENIKSYIA